MKLSATEYEQRLRHYQKQRSGEFVVSSFYGKWAADVRLERELQQELKAQGIEWGGWKRAVGSSARAGSLKALFEKG